MVHLYYTCSVRQKREFVHIALDLEKRRRVSQLRESEFYESTFGEFDCDFLAIDRLFAVGCNFGGQRIVLPMERAVEGRAKAETINKAQKDARGMF